MIGTKLAHYEITHHLGTGGMGEVYQATDSRLRRSVAIKLLPEAFMHDADRVARFEREARVLASLNHPNIAAIYGVEESAGRKFLVMELVPGETLAERIKRGPMPVDEALTIAKKIAEALEAAHEKGMVHRDLKPANVKITPDDSVKLLDFGLAKAYDAELPAQSSLSNSPTISRMATQQGVILGTAAYMSPEQARGKAVDKRADIWAFGVVLHEMITGRCIFAGEDATATLAKVIETEPSMKGVPLLAQPLLKKCLEKDPKNRLRDIGDAWTLLADASTSSSRQVRGGWLWPSAAAIFALTTGIALWSAWRSPAPADLPLMRLDVDLGADVALDQNGFGSNIVVSPDGTRLAYVSGTPPKLFVRRLDQQKAVEIPRTDTPAMLSPFFSPDSMWIGWWSPGRLAGFFKALVDGGAPVPLRGSGGPPGASWGDDDKILAAGFLGTEKFLFRIPSNGGSPETIPNQMYAYSPWVLPGSRGALITTAKDPTDPGSAAIEFLSFADGKTKPLAPGTTGRYVPTGHLLYANGSRLFAIPLDLDRMQTHGSPVPILEDVAFSRDGAGGAQYDVSRAQSGHGVLVYQRITGEAGPLTTIQWVDPTGNHPLLKQPGRYGAPHFSPNGKQMVFLVREGPNPFNSNSGKIYIYDLGREQLAPLTSGGESAFISPLWTADGQYVLLASVQGIFWIRADGVGQPQKLIPNAGLLIPRSVTSNRKWLAYTDGPRGAAIVALEEKDGQLMTSGPPQHFMGNEPAFSPDGKWLAYSASVGGERGRRGGRGGRGGSPIYVRAFQPAALDQSRQWSITDEGGEARWSPVGHTLFYRAGDQIMAVDYTVKGEEFFPEKARVWIEKLGGLDWDLSHDGKGVAVVTPLQTSAPPKADHTIVLLLNFFDYLRQRVPVGGK